MSGTVNGIPARQFPGQLVHYIRARVAFNTPGIAAGAQVGTLPAGAIILSTRVNVVTAFNAATTNDVAVGTAAGGAQIAAAAQVAAGTAGAKSPSAGDGLRVAADTGIFVTYTQAGAAATAGAADVVVAFVPDADR